MRTDAPRRKSTRHPHARGAMYLAGYAIECKLKAIAMEIYDCWTLDQLAARWEVGERQVYTHGLEALASRLPLYANSRRSEAWRDFATEVNFWRPAWRYNPYDVTTDEAESFLAATAGVFAWLDSNRS